MPKAVRKIGGPMSKERKSHWGIVVAVMVLIAFSIWLLTRVAPSRKFDDITLDQDTKPLNALAGRHVISVPSTSQEGLLNYVGVVLVVDKVTPGAKPVFSNENTIRTFRPTPETMLVKPLNKILFEGKVTRGLNAGGTYAVFTGNLDEKQAADVVVTDEIYFGFKDPTKIPYAALRRLKMEPGKAYYFIESATLTTTTHKVYQQVSADAAISGTAFQANGKVYASNSGFIYDAVLGVDLFDIGLLQPDEGGGDPKIAELASQPTLSADAARRLGELLRASSKEAARSDLSNAAFKAE
jgi:hypothetical protein